MVLLTVMVGHGGSSQGGNGGTGGGGGSVGGVKNVQAGNARGATNNAPIIVGPTADVINGKPRVVAGHYGSSVSLGGATGGSNRVSNNGNRAGNGGGSRGHSNYIPPITPDIIILLIAPRLWR